MRCLENNFISLAGDEIKDRTNQAKDAVADTTNKARETIQSGAENVEGYAEKGEHKRTLRISCSRRDLLLV